MAGRSAAVSAATRVLIWTGRSSSPAQRSASRVRSKVPGTPRMESCRCAVEPSRLSPTASTPCSFSSASISRVSAGVAAGVMETPMPSRRASSISGIKAAAQQGISAGQDQLRQGLAELGNLAQELESFFYREFAGVWFGHSLGAAMPAGESAGLRHFPVHVQRRLRKIAQFVWVEG